MLSQTIQHLAVIATAGSQGQLSPLDSLILPVPRGLSWTSLEVLQDLGHGLPQPNHTPYYQPSSLPHPCCFSRLWASTITQLPRLRLSYPCLFSLCIDPVPSGLFQQCLIPFLFLGTLGSDKCHTSLALVSHSKHRNRTCSH